MSKKELLHRFDTYIDSRISIILNWFWKSGLFIFVIGIALQNLNAQRINSDQIVLHNSNIRHLMEDSNRVISENKEQENDIDSLEKCTEGNKSDIKYLRRDVDGLMYPIISTPGNNNG